MIDQTKNPAGPNYTGKRVGKKMKPKKLLLGRAQEFDNYYFVRGRTESGTLHRRAALMLGITLPYLRPGQQCQIECVKGKWRKTK